MTAHNVRRYADDAGFIASCSCGWRARATDRTWRDDLATQHEEDS